MTSGKLNKTDSEQFLLLLINEAQKLVVQIRPTSGINNSIDITAKTNDENDQPDPLRIPEVIIVISVLLLWCGSIFIFIRHSDILRIRHRDLPYRTSIKPPMNLNHITVVHRTSDMVIHSKPRLSSTTTGLTTNIYNHTIDGYENPDTNLYYPRKEQHAYSFDSNNSVPKYSHHDEQFLDPYMIPSEVRKSLLNLHRKSMDNIANMRYSMSYSTNDVSTRKETDDHQSIIDERCVQESPV